MHNTIPMEEGKSRFTKRLGIAATIVSLTGGSIALWKQVQPEEALPDLSGRWTITNTVSASNSGKFDGEVYVYSVGVTQTADHKLEGKGEQTHYNGKAAPGRWPINLDSGKLTKEDVVINFTIEGNRVFTGTMRLRMQEDDDRRLTGTFAYTAAGTKGVTEVRIE